MLPTSTLGLAANYVVEFGLLTRGSRTKYGCIFKNRNKKEKLFTENMNRTSDENHKYTNGILTDTFRNSEVFLIQKIRNVCENTAKMEPHTRLLF